jgi:prefoldin subunit 5
MTEDTLNIEEIKMQNKTISKILVVILMTSMIIAILPTIPVTAAPNLAEIDPVVGNVGTKVTLTGTIDFEGGPYTVWFDTNDNGSPDPGEDVKSGNAPANQINVETSFNVPPCLGSDTGEDHRVWLQDATNGQTDVALFNVITSREISVTPTHTNEGEPVTLELSIDGGAQALTLYSFNVGITNPDLSMYTGEVSFITDAFGSGSNTTVVFPADFSTGANTNFTGTYTVTANRTLPGIVNDWGSTSFTVGLTDSTSYGRFETIGVKTSGWTPGQDITITIKDPADQTVKQWVNVTATDGTVSGTYVIPWNATMGTYTIEAVNVTGTEKDVASMHTFEIGSAALTVTITSNPVGPFMRTETASAMFTIQYPDLTYYTNTTQFSSLEVSAYYNNTLVGVVPLTAADYMGMNEWTFSWKIPRDAVVGSGYKFTLAKDSILDTNDNHGPTSAVSTTTFTINPAVLAVELTKQPAENYTRTEPAMAMINITYPDNTFFTDADLGTINASVNQGATNLANFTLDASAFNATTNQWTIEWASPWNATLANDYLLWVMADMVEDASGNMGPVMNVIAAPFEMLVVVPTVDMITTDKASYARGEFVQIYFDATYADGSPVVTGTSTVNVVAPDGFSATTLNPVHTSNGRWAVTWWASEASQVGSYNITLAVNGLTDAATPGNMGPATAAMASFTILPSDFTLEDLNAAINALQNQLDAIEADTNALGSSIAPLQSSVVSLAELVADLQAQVDSLSATAATDADVSAVSTAVSAVSSDISAIETKINALSTQVGNTATPADVASVQAAVDSITADIAALETKMNTLSSAVGSTASNADLTEATDDLTDQIGGLNTMVIIAVVLALIAAIAAILAVYIIQRKIAG